MSVLRSFRQMVGLLSRGDFSRHCDKLLSEAIEALENSPADKCKAEINLKIVFEFELGRIDVKAEAKSKLPDTVKFMKTPFWSIDGALSVEHPNQIDMFPPKKVHDRSETDDEDEERETA